ncbi:MAG: hypothetical protein AMXMBFR4_00920 [Candidatus Hydrogenedentota bacterium]
MTVPFPVPSYFEACFASIALRTKQQKREKPSKSQAVPKAMQITVGQRDKATVLTRISHQSLPMTGATGEKCSGDSIEVNRVRIFHTNSPFFALSLHNGMCCTKLYPSLPEGVKNPG